MNLTGLHRGPLTAPPVYVAAVGDSNSIVTWSGIPFHFLEAGKQREVFEGGLPLATEGRAWMARRIAWNLLRIALGERRGGYQYSVQFLETLWRPVHPRLRHAATINCFQLYAPSLVTDSTVRKWFFLDQTLLQLFDHYQQRAKVGRAIADDALRREAEGYHAAAGVIVHSRWAAQSVINDYNVDPTKVHVVLPGANIDPALYEAWEAQAVPPAERLSQRDELRLVFVGKEWERKGLDRLLAGFTVARKRNIQARLLVIGCPRKALPARYRNVDGVEWIGFVDKRHDPLRFLQLVSDNDVGCLLSRAEAGGISQREFHALGLIVMGTSAGGAPEHRFADASISIDTDDGPEAIAHAIETLTEKRERTREMLRIAWRRRHEALWSTTITRLAPILFQPVDFPRRGPAYDH